MLIERIISLIEVFKYSDISDFMIKYVQSDQDMKLCMLGSLFMGIRNCKTSKPLEFFLKMYSVSEPEDEFTKSVEADLGKLQHNLLRTENGVAIDIEKQKNNVIIIRNRYKNKGNTKNTYRVCNVDTCSKRVWYGKGFSMKSIDCSQYLESQVIEQIFEKLFKVK